VNAGTTDTVSLLDSCGRHSGSCIGTWRQSQTQKSSLPFFLLPALAHTPPFTPLFGGCFSHAPPTNAQSWSTQTRGAGGSDAFHAALAKPLALPRQDLFFIFLPFFFFLQFTVVCRQISVWLWSWFASPFNR